MGGPVYRYDAALDSPVKFPEAYDGDFFAGEFGRRWIKRIEQGADGTVQSINDVPWTGTQVMDMAFGPDGALYVLDYGTAWFGGDETLRPLPHRERHRRPLPGRRGRGRPDLRQGAAEGRASPPRAPPTPTATPSPTAGTSATAARPRPPNPTHTYKKNGTYTATVTAKDPTGRTGSASVQIVVGNTAPKVTLRTPRGRRSCSPSVTRCPSR